MRLIVTGRQGQLVRSLVERGAEAGVEIVCLGRPELDLAEPDAIASAIASTPADVVISAAAYTAVDRAEIEPDLARRVNRDGARAVALAAAQSGRAIIHVSTDYVFDGALDRPFREEDPVGPINVYGRSKLDGEIAVAEANPRHVIARASWVFSPFGQNFIKTMLRLTATRDAISVVDDQWGAPTSALDLADALIAMARRIVDRPDDAALYGVFHTTNESYGTWATFAGAIFEEAEKRGRKPARVMPVATSQYPTLARRPANSRLDVAKLRNVYGVSMPDWRASMNQCVARLVATENMERRSL